MSKKINCDIDNCLYNNNEEGECTLKKITVSSLCDGCECITSSSTQCQSFENSGAIINDNEYEVDSDLEFEGYQ